MRYKKRDDSFLGVEPTLATIPARFIAMMIDLGVIMLIFYLIFILLKGLGFKIEHIELMNFHRIEMKSDEMSANNIQLLKVLLALVPTIYFTLSIYFTNGQTIGKRILGIRIVSFYHQRISFWHRLERSLGYIVSTLEIGLGFLQVFWNPNRMSLHDRIAETLVIRTLKNK
jgi:uncharacterized RDD family membrane protein YckC